jgi:capsular polysaccharide biosynthesis protein
MASQNPDRLQEDFYHKDEIDLMDYLKVIWKWKYLIVIVTLVCAVVAAVASFQMKKVYEFNTVIQPGILKILEDGSFVYIDTANNIKATIDGETFNETIVKNIADDNTDSPTKSLTFKTKILSGSSALKVTYATSKEELGLQILNDLNKQIIIKYEAIVNYYKGEWETKIIQKKLEMEDIKAILESINNEMQIVAKTINRLEEEKNLVKENTASLIKQRDKFVSHEEDNKNVLSALLFTNTIQQNITLERDYGDDLNMYISMKEGFSLQLEKTKIKIKTIQETIKNYELSKSMIQNIQVLKSPQKNFYPISPNKRKNVLMAFVVGLLMTIFLAFLIEYVVRHKNGKSA